MWCCRILLASCFTVVLAGALAAAPPSAPKRVKAKDGPLGMKFVSLSKATFYMGGGRGKAGKKMRIRMDFEIAIHTVTQGQWHAVMDTNPNFFSRRGIEKKQIKDITDEKLAQFPVEGVSWEDAQKFIKEMNENEHGNGYFYRLPTEAEWEYACRGGATTEKECSYDFHFDKPTNHLSAKQANFNNNTRYPLVPFFDRADADKGPFLNRPTKVGSYAPNNLGLYDMHGNVWQWCADLDDPKGSDRVLRGGSWRDWDVFCCAASRQNASPTLHCSVYGFRLARVLLRKRPYKPE